jgi:hypothetical protein
MDGLASLLFPQAPSYAQGLLGADEARNLQQQAQRSGLLNIGLGLLAAGAPSAVRTGTGAGLVQGLMAGQEAYQRTYQQRLQEMEMMRKLQEQQRAQQMQQALQQLAPAAAAGDQQAQAALAGIMSPQQFQQLMSGIETSAKMRAPERITVSEGQQVFERTPQGLVPIAGGPKEQKPAGSVLEAMQVLGINLPVNELSPDQRKQVQNYIDRKEELKSPKIAVDLKDPTAIAKAQSGILGDWRSVLKDVGALEVRDRYSAAVNAVRQGNAGNKAADGALIYAVGKIYDPSGAVQEGDKNTILGNRSIPDKIRAVAQSVFNGEALLPSERNQLLAVVTEQVKSRAQSIEAQKAPYAALSRQLGGDGSFLTNPLADILTNLPQEAPGALNMQDIQRQASEELRRRRGQ